MTHFQRRLLEIHGEERVDDLFSCPTVKCACANCSLCGQPLHTLIHVGSGRIGHGGGWRHAFREGA